MDRWKGEGAVRACHRGNHSSGNVEMVKEIGMRMGGPSERNQIWEGGVVSEETHSTGGKKDEKSNKKRKLNKRARTCSDTTKLEKPVRAVPGVRQRKNETSTFSKHWFYSSPQRPIMSWCRHVDWKEKISPKQRTDGGNVCGVEIVLSKTYDQTCFAHSAVSDE